MAIPFNKIKIEEIEGIEKPVVKFRWNLKTNRNMSENMDYLIKNNIIYVLIFGDSNVLPQIR